MKGGPHGRQCETLNKLSKKRKKYLLDAKTAGRFFDRLQEYMQVDQYGKSTICSLYYDTDDYRLIHRSIEKPKYKEKFRLRCYGRADENTEIFAEIKKKYDGIVYKRRVRAPYLKMQEFLENGATLPEDPQIQAEVWWMLKRYGLKPKVFLSCERIALYGKEDKNVRITFDTNLRYRTEDLSLLSGDHGTPYMPEDFCVMEIKFPGAAPLWLAELLDEFHILPGSFSKIGTCCRKCVFPQLNQ